MRKRMCLYILTALVAMACNRDGGEDMDKDMDRPVITMNADRAFPTNCATLYRGERFEFRAVFTDNRALGNYNIEIHQNFDHHSHSTGAEECPVDPEKTPYNPFVFNQSFAIPGSPTYYEATAGIAIPAEVDAGDYHFMVRLTDRAGWQQLAAVSVKIADRN